MSDLKAVISRRKTVRKKVTVCYDKRDNYRGLDPALQTTERGLLLNYQKSLLELDQNVFELKFSDDGVTEAALDTESDICQDYQDRIQICLSLLPASLSNHSNVSIDNARSLLKQPTAPLPRFTSKENEDFTSFLKEFLSTTSSFTYPDRDLLLLLKQQVDGRAKLLLDSLEVDKQTFNDAVELLKAAFASESTRKVNTIRQLTELKLGLSDDPYSYISKFRTILQSSRIDKDMKFETPIENKLFGLTWNRISDEIFTKPINLNADASTKREVLTTIAAQFDIFGFNLPLMNRRKENPADSTTRPFSYRSLMKTNFLIGPDSNFIKTEDELSVVIPNPLTVDKMAPVIDHNVYVGINSEHSPNSSGNAHLIDPNDISDFRRLVLIHRRVLRCVMKWKQKIGIEGSSKSPNSNLFAQALTQIISTEQKLFFPEVFSYFQDQKVRLEDLPKIVTQLNVFLDNNNVIRVKSKFKTWDGQNEFPILLPRDSALTRLIVLDAHSKLSHSGCYAVLSAIRRTFYVPKHFSTIKKILKTCVHCRRFNNRTFQLNQNVYREFRSDPPSIPFNNVFIDYLGPFTVKKDSESQKVWLLIFACTWSRGIDLRICNDLSVKEFLRSFQLHCFNYGVPQLVVSDLGSQLVAGANIIHDFISDHETRLYFEENNVKPLTFQQYFKGCSKLGSLVETCVKMVKRLLFGSIKNWVLSFAEFEFVVEHTKHLVNKRPIAFKNGLREANVNDVPEPITPEKLIRGYDTLSLNLIPSLQGMPHDPDWQAPVSSTSRINDEFEKLRKVRQNLIENYHSEFLGTLLSQAIDKKDRYRPAQQHNIKVGDIVLLKELNTKPSSYPMAIVQKLEVNSNGEVTGVTLLNGKTKEIIKRHISTLIPYLEVKDLGEDDCIPTPDVEQNNDTNNLRVRRKAAILSEQRTREYLNI
ncbi:uncharacterized protein [Palaemon carinicauda]|uniref:uncharacterized protein n=1 Tax=Palaemon carinicauda TaxID=392227 RepID=UPI0035B5F332